MGFFPTVQQEIPILSPSICGVCPKNAELRLSSLETFRNAIISTSRRSGFYIAVNSSRKVLGQTGDGHFSPIAGYHSASDMCLIMDVARFKYPPYWCPVPLLYQALETKDPVSENTRGFVLLSRSKNYFPETLVSHVDTTSLLNLPKKITEDILIFPTKDFLVIVLHYFYRIYEDLTQEIINNLNTQLEKIQEPVLHPELLSLVQDMNPNFTQISKLLKLVFEKTEFEEPLCTYIKRLKNDLGMSSLDNSENVPKTIDKNNENQAIETKSDSSNSESVNN